MKENEDLTTDDEFGAADRVTASTTENELSKQFVHPGYTFKGQKLRPYTAGTDLLFSQILDRENDAPFTIFLSFIFIHLAERPVAAGVSPASFRHAAGTAATTGNLLELCWDKLKFRAALLDWIDSLGPLTNDDKTESMKLFEEIRGWAQKSSVETIDGPQKKTKATRRRRSRA